MRYKKAQDLFPEEIITLIQQYVDGEYIYIPRKPEKKKAWGENSRVREELRERNEQIFKDYQTGLSKCKLAEQYFLSEKSIERIILKEKNKQMVL
ncbi:MAG: hypothetical protein J6F30_07085 [Cellulosilyticum sp.]|nr:hypothetical protein [Cellulosilyticum sp.]